MPTIPSVYINLEDSVKVIAARIKRQRSGRLILVCPKHCFLFSDPINLKLLKTEVDLAGKDVHILTMDENGRAYAQAVGFGLREVPGAAKASSALDIQPTQRPHRAAPAPAEPAPEPEPDLEQAAIFSGLLAKAGSLFSAVEDEEPAGDEPNEEEIAKKPVLPPLVAVTKRAEPQPEEFVEAQIKDTIFPKELEEHIELDKKNSRLGRRLLGLAVLALLVLAAVVFAVLPGAEVVVYPKTQDIPRDLVINLSSTAPSPDPAQLLLPAQKITQSLEAQETFQTEGKKQVGNASSGTVKIYNFTKAPINLKAATTQLTVNGQTYLLGADLVQIKPTRYANAVTHEVDPTSLGDSVPITAATGGEAGNLPAGTRLEISNQVFGSKPQLLYAKTDSPVTGGVSRYLSVVTDQDLSAAKEKLTQDILSQLRAQLAEKNELLLDNAYVLQVTDFSPDKQVNAQSPNFSVQLKADVSGLAFDKNALQKLIFDRVNQSISAGQTLRPDPNLEKSYTIKSFDFNVGVAVLDAHFQSQSVYSVDVSGLAGQLVGKTPAQVNTILTAKPEIDRIDLTLSPSWQKTFPWFAKKIKITVKN